MCEAKIMDFEAECFNEMADCSVGQKAENVTLTRQRICGECLYCKDFRSSLVSCAVVVFRFLSGLKDGFEQLILVRV